VLPPEKQNSDAPSQNDYSGADLYPVLDRRGVPINDRTPPGRETGIDPPDLSLDKAAPQFAASIYEQIERHDTSDDFIEKELHCR
jgi:hypothetical protein